MGGQTRSQGVCGQCGESLIGYPARTMYCYECSLPTSHPDYSRYRNRLTRYGVDRTMWDAMWFEQDGQCAVESCTNRATVLDHNHDTGKPRAILCNTCNVGLGYITLSDWVIEAQRYLNEW